jgi:deazaflavin-dependent oxidoreductase (nitroreductase family)
MMGGMDRPEPVAALAKTVNPTIEKVANGFPPFAVVHHVGRTSGREYTTPVAAFAGRDPDSAEILAVIPLPWGPRTDWMRNVTGAGSFELTRGSTTFHVDLLRVLSAEEAVTILAPVPRQLLQAVALEECLVGRLRRVPSAHA